ncbi:FxSxx-COOH system tetratricopeptide repeat protein [Actinoplanes sp. NPDC049681]|uniref:FxSxx-COOH system tetratricopeptide repeat protein n=1 Tax=Actinoplanes sp. NPDC049681 TaxID=3363905 RepID=UPI003793202C
MSDASRIFISYAGRDRPWAEWARWHLASAGYRTELDCVDWKAGDNFVERMHEGLQRANPMLLLLSSAYLDPKRFTTDEWTARLAQRRKDPEAKLIPVRVDRVDLAEGIWAPIVVPDVFDLAADEAAVRLLDTVGRVLEPETSAVGVAPPYPDGPANPAGTDVGPRPPGSLPPVCNLARRNPAFTGRDKLLSQVRDALSGGARVAVQALHGMGGVGKTQLVLEYAYRFAGEYDLVWWVSAEQTGLIGEQFAALGVELGIIDAAADSMVAKSKVLGHLSGRGRWLLVFDNVVNSEDVLPWLPRGGGHVLITSRQGNWYQIADAVELDVLPRDEAVAFLTGHRSGLDCADADRLAEALGDLPLALAQAVGYLTQTGMSVAEYRQLLSEETEAVLALGRPVDYPQSLAAAITLSVSALSELDAASVAILQLCAFLAPEPVSVDLIMEVAAPGERYPQALNAARDVIGKPLARQQAIGRLGAYGLAKLGSGTVTVHRLTQAVVRSQLEQPVSEELVAHLEATLGGMRPGDPRDAANWPAWARLLPHLLAAKPARTDDPVLRECVRDAVVYLISRGDPGPARQLASSLYDEWKQRLGADHRDTLRAATELVWALRDLGEYDQLRPLIDDTLTRQIKMLGQDDPDTLRSAADLAVVHGAWGNARRAAEIERDVWERRRRVLGEEHPDTLISAGNVARSWGVLGRYREALALQQQVREQQRRALGEEHPDTLKSAANVAKWLGELGRYREALALQQQVREQQRRALGEQHPDTLLSAGNVAKWLGELGRYREALALKQQVWEQQRRALGEQHPDTLIAASNVARSLGELGRHQEALTLQQQVWEQQQRGLGEEHPHTLTTAANVATSLSELGRHQEALTLKQQVWEQQQRVLGEEHPATLTTAGNVATSLSELGRDQEALTLQQQVWEQRRRVLGDEHPDTLTSAGNVASSLGDLRRYQEALTLRQQVWEQRRRVLGEEHPATLTAGLNLAIVQFNLGRLLPARHLADQGWKGLRDMLGDQHPDTRWASGVRKAVKNAMGGRPGGRPRGRR